jgi:peptidoglycan hydrolase CwlO-like protein
MNNQYTTDSQYQKHQGTTTGQEYAKAVGANNSGAETWNLREPEKLVAEKTTKNAGKAVDFAKARTKNLNELADKIITEETEFINRERDFLNNINQKLESISTQVRATVRADIFVTVNEEQEISELTQKKQALQTKATASAGKLGSSDKEIAEVKARINEWNNKKKQIAAKINPHDLAHTKFPHEKAILYDLYRWCIVTVYNEPEAAFYWPNFKEEAFIKDKGFDFLNRLKGLRYKLGSEATSITDRVVKARDAIAKDIATNSNISSIQELFNYVVVVGDLIGLVDKLKQLDTDTDKLNQENELAQLELESINTQIDGITGKIKLFKQFKETLNIFSDSMKNVENSCKQRIDKQGQLAERMRADLSNFNFNEQSPEKVRETTTPEMGSSSPQKHEHKTMHANVKSSMKETDFSDSGKDAKSCQPSCTIF